MPVSIFDDLPHRPKRQAGGPLGPQFVGSRLTPTFEKPEGLPEPLAARAEQSEFYASELDLLTAEARFCRILHRQARELAASAPVPLVVHTPETMKPGSRRVKPRTPGIQMWSKR